MHSENAAITFDNDVAAIGGGFSDQSDAGGIATFERGGAADLAANPLGARARFAKASAGENEPCDPIPSRCLLCRASPESPVVKQMLGLGLSQTRQSFLLCCRAQRGERFGERFRL